MTSKICYYYQTFIGLEKLLDNPLLVDIIIVSSIHFGNNKDGSPYIHLNDNNPDSKVFNNLWQETEELSKNDVKIMIMMGGAGGAYEYLFRDFTTYYPMLIQTIKKYPWITGIDLDIEETVDINNVKNLIRKLKIDLGYDFTITMAPIQSSLSEDGPGMGGFSYKDLYNSVEGLLISHFNVQCYSSYTCDAIDLIINNGYPQEKIIMGMLGGDYDPNLFQSEINEVKKVKKKYNNIGGVFSWEYCNSPPNKTDPSIWASEMGEILKDKLFTYWKLIGNLFSKKFYQNIL